jgi:hypothetical protein
MTKRATQDLLEQLHGLIAQDMLDRLQSGACEAKDWAVIVKFLKDNGIDGLASDREGAENAFDALVQAAQASIKNYHPN